MENTIAVRNELISQYFAKNNVDIAFMGEKERPIIVDKLTGEALNCVITNNDTILFRFNKEQPKIKFYLSIDKLFEENNFNFEHWFKYSSKKKIYIFQNENQFFKIYNVKNETYIPIFTKSLDWAYFVFRYEKALIFKQKMNLKGINLKIKKEWENNRIKKTC